MALDTTVSLTNTWSCINSGSAAAGLVSLYPIDCQIEVYVSSSTTSPGQGQRGIIIPPSTQGGGWINRTILEMFPGSASATYIHCRTQSGTGAVWVSCA